MSKTNQYLFTFLLNLSTWNPIWSFKKSVTTDKSGVVMKKSICYPSKHELLFHLFFLPRSFSFCVYNQNLCECTFKLLWVPSFSLTSVQFLLTQTPC